MNRPCHPRCVALLSFILLLLAAAAPALAGDVWVDFTSDFHDGNSGASNGVADWIDELNEATTRSGGVTNGTPSQNQFSIADRQEIEASILADLELIYADYNLNFVTQQPTGAHDVVYLGADNDAEGISNSLRGRASGDLGNTRTRTYQANPDGDPSGVSKVYTGNFNGSIEPAFNTRQESIDEISTALAGTAAHELGHSFGLFHHFTYSADGISSDSTSTGGQQNQHILATGSTGVSEADRESLRSLSPFSRVILDIAGGSQTHGGAALVNNPVLSDTSELNGGDAGDSLSLATQLHFSIGESSGKEISFIEADLDNVISDIDVYQFSTTVETTLSAHVFTSRRPGLDNFDSVLELVDAAGTVVGISDDIGWDDNQFGDIANPDDDDTGSFLANLTVDPGNYFLRVSTATNDIDAAANVGDGYWLVTSLDRQIVIGPGDFDNDGDVDGDDVDFYIGNLGQPAVGELAQLDLDTDGDVTLADHNLHVAYLVQTLNGNTGALLGDVNLDGVVDVLADGATLVNNLGNPSTSRSQGDLNADGTVDVLGDAAILINDLGGSNEGSSGGPSASAVPEPGTASLLTIAAIGVVFRRRR